MILIIDNYDSFTYNIYQYVGEIKEDVEIIRNDLLSVEEIKKMHPEKIIISPGPGRPENAGVCPELVKSVHDIPILGICLGHQVIGYAYGGKIVSAPEIKHGKTSTIIHDEKGIFKGLKNPLTGMRYHSLVVERSTLPPDLVITAQTDDGTIMGIRHRNYPIYGLQFHPESIMTDFGKQMIENFIKINDN
ncbi:anthranilate synthase component II [Athalassotoga saccharophila]|uniref:anthranilate synthase component II n=1 Tax=Athalassotoga saccharophila TaxID=1441386 RepID=UPI00137B0CC3|nr:aminodeoxychorismate/anthranilate synthase component II [Athalassotoga saccharophila]BBJ28080.1 aminodeoxychorismate/anthranilate synthase component 2 [Athalassotoga saccharophila]